MENKKKTYKQRRHRKEMRSCNNDEREKEPYAIHVKLANSPLPLLHLKVNDIRESESKLPFFPSLSPTQTVYKCCMLIENGFKIRGLSNTAFNL